jgi:hypothetical protein
MDERYRPPREETARPTSTIVELRTHVFVTFGAALSITVGLAILNGEVEAKETVLVFVIALAAIGVDLLRWRRRRRLRRADDPEAIVAVDGERMRTLARADVVVVYPSGWVTGLLLLAFFALFRMGGLHPHTIAEAFPRPLFGVLVVSSLWHRYTRRRVRLPGEWWGRWFARDDLAQLFPEEFECPPVDPESTPS